MPGATTYLDTPTVPIRAFSAGGTGFSTAPASGTPVIASVDGPGAGVAPLICTDTNPLPANVVLSSLGPTPGHPIRRPAPTSPATYGFGATQGTVTLNGASLTVVPGSWNDSAIGVTVPLGATTGTLMVTRADGLSTQVGWNLSITNCAATAVHTVGFGGDFPTTQEAIDDINTVAGDLILVAPGTYNENVVMYKPVRLQGAGSGSTFINANPNPLDRLQAFHAKVDGLGARDFAAYLLKDPFTGPPEAPGIFVIGELNYPERHSPDRTAGHQDAETRATRSNVPSLIDGFHHLRQQGRRRDLRGRRGEATSPSATTTSPTTRATLPVVSASAPLMWGFDSQNDNVIVRNKQGPHQRGVDGSGGIAMNEGSESYLVEAIWSPAT